MTKNKNKNTTSAIIRSTVSYTILALLILCNVAYAIIVSDHASKRYALERLQASVQEKNEQRQHYRVSIAQLQSSERIRDAAVRLNLVRAEAPVYLEPIGPVAMKR